MSCLVSYLAADGRPLLASGGDETIQLWDPETGQPVDQPLTGHSGITSTLCSFKSRAGRSLLASGSPDATIRIWDPATGRQLGEPLPWEHRTVTNLTAYTNTQGAPRLVAVGRDHQVQCWDPIRRNLLLDMSAKPSGDSGAAVHVTSCTNTQGEPMLVVVGGDPVIRLWQPETQILLSEYPIPPVFKPQCISAGAGWLAIGAVRGLVALQV